MVPHCQLYSHRACWALSGKGNSTAVPVVDCQTENIHGVTCQIFSVGTPWPSSYASPLDSSHNTPRCRLPGPQTPTCKLPDRGNPMECGGDLRRWLWPGAMLGLVIISRWHQHEQQMPFWPQGPTGREKVYVCVCACVCMLFTGRSSYLLPPHLSGHLPHSARKECLFHCKMAIPSQNDNVIIQRRTRTHTRRWTI